jgi:hypothetical protein
VPLVLEHEVVHFHSTGWARARVLQCLALCGLTNYGMMCNSKITHMCVKRQRFTYTSRMSFIPVEEDSFKYDQAVALLARLWPGLERHQRPRQCPRIRRVVTPLYCKLAEDFAICLQFWESPTSRVSVHTRQLQIFVQRARATVEPCFISNMVNSINSGVSNSLSSIHQTI